MFVKICGTTNLPDAKLAVELGADALGFIFAPSKRQVSAAEAAAIAGQLPASVLRVGVFTDPDVPEIVRIVRAVGLGAVQMHWPYDRALSAALRGAMGEDVLLWQVVGFPADAADQQAAQGRFLTELRAAMLDGCLEAVLLDTVKAGSSGGLGEAFSWEQARPLVQAVQREAHAGTTSVPRLVVAGGLRAENVGDAMQVLEPWGVDVVSGVEAGPGRKSPDRLAAFLSAAKRF